MIESQAGKHDRAIEIFRDAINIAREFELHVYLGTNLNLLAGSLAVKGHIDEALSAVQESIAIHRRSRQRLELYWATDTYAQILYSLGRYEQSLELFKECYTIIFNEFAKYLLSKASITNRLGFVSFRLGNVHAARQHFIDALHYLTDLPQQYFSNRLNAIIGLAQLSYEDGQPMHALTMLYVAARYSMPEGPDNYVQEARDLTAKLEAELSPEDIATARQQAESLDLDTLIGQLLQEYGQN